MLTNKFGNEIKVINLGDIYRQIQEANNRHLKNVRIRYLDYMIKMKSLDDRVITNAILAERMYKQQKGYKMELTPEEQQKLKRQAKIERLRTLQKQYRMLENGASPEERLALKCESAVLAKRLEVASRGR